jgi:4-amino-4-deoxy-L-arabinose transferase-like glycosyltransferase
MRLVALGEHPYGLYQDEAVNGLDALDVLAGARPLYFTANNGREPFFIYLIAASVGIFGRTPLGIRAAAALVGLLALPATYLLGRAWGGSRVGWLSTGILAVMLWHVHLSRIGLRAVSLPLFSALALGLGALALQRQSRRLAVAAGAVYGLSFYTYLAARFTPIALILMLAYGAIWHRGWLRERWRLLIWMVVAAAFIVLPLAIFAALHPDIVLGRSGQVAIWHRADFLSVLVEHTLRTLGMFNWRGDWIWRHNVPNRPVFDPLMGLAFLVGAALGLLRWRQRPALALSLIWLVVMMLPTILADDAPHFLRGVGVLPVGCFSQPPPSTKELPGCRGDRTPDGLRLG